MISEYTMQIVTKSLLIAIFLYLPIFIILYVSAPLVINGIIANQQLSATQYSLLTWHKAASFYLNQTENLSAHYQGLKTAYKQACLYLFIANSPNYSLVC